jgi:hypothetical protein
MSDQNTTPDGTSPTEEIDPEILKKALDQVRTIARGNGIDAAKIEVKNFDGGLYRFPAVSIFQIKTRSSEKRVSGKENGEVVAAGQMAQLVASTIDKVIQSPDTYTHILNVLKKRPDKGFGGNGIIVALDALSRTFVSHLPCSLCGSRGKVPCVQCSARGEEPCPRCHGRREMTCPTCRGTQFTGSGPNRSACTRCNGRGRVPCNTCQHSGAVTCRACAGTCATPCTGCASTGWQSTVTRLEITAQGWFDYDRLTMLPAKMRDYLREIGPEAVVQNHVHVNMNESPELAEQLKGNPDELPVVYQAAASWGRLTLGLPAAEGETPLEVYVFGQNPKLIHVPAFLEKPTQPGRDALRRAAIKGGDVAKEIRNAARYRVLSETIVAAARFPTRKAYDLVVARYPFGIDHETLRALGLEARAALSQLTRRPRRIGLLIGLALAGAWFAASFFTRIRNAALVQALIYTRPDVAEPLVDFILFAAGAMAATFSVRIAAAKVLHDTLGPLLKNKSKGGKEKKHRTGRTTGMSGACIFFCAVIFLLVCGGAMATQRPVPPWFGKPVKQAMAAYEQHRNKPSFEEALQKAHERDAPPPPPKEFKPMSTHLPDRPDPFR